MKWTILIGLMCLSQLNLFSQGKEMSDESDTKEIMIVREMIEAVNTQNAEMYVRDFSSDVSIIMDGKVRVNGKSALQSNRADHFKRYPKMRSAIQHIVQIGNKVILHDQVWLTEKANKGSDIVEIFTFENGKIKMMEVIQAEDLLEEESKNITTQDNDN